MANTAHMRLSRRLVLIGASASTLGIAEVTGGVANAANNGEGSMVKVFFQVNG
jgi:hypothetical protein